MQVSYFVSTIKDGTMRSMDGDAQTAQKNRRNFIRTCGLKPADTTLHTLSYGQNNYCRYRTLSSATKGDGITKESTVDADAVVVTQPNHGILLPLADCIGAVIYDSKQGIMMVSHLGRHNLEQNGGTRCINYLIDRFAVRPEDLKIWLSPSAGKENYPLYDFGNRSLQEVAVEQLLVAGIESDHIELSTIDTTTNPDYYSHSAFLKNNKKTDGRFAIVAMLR